jgi:hypothetical protein
MAHPPITVPEQLLAQARAGDFDLATRTPADVVQLLHELVREHQASDRPGGDDPSLHNK